MAAVNEQCTGGSKLAPGHRAVGKKRALVATASAQFVIRDGFRCPRCKELAGTLGIGG
jgi:hypothetical protein